MIKESKPLTLAEVSEIVGTSERAEKVKSFIKKFSKTKPQDSKKIKDDLRALDLIKLKERDIVKIADFLPTDQADLNKILPETSLDQEETNKILELITRS